jgi:hypothetical protein
MVVLTIRLELLRLPWPRVGRAQQPRGRPRCQGPLDHVISVGGEVAIVSNGAHGVLGGQHLAHLRLRGRPDHSGGAAAPAPPGADWD